MTGDCHVRFGERLVGRFRWPTQLDLTIDYTALSNGADPMVTLMTRTAVDRLTDKLREAVARHVREVVVPYLQKQSQEELASSLSVEISPDGEQVRIRYPTSFETQSRYVGNSVLLEFGGRNTTLPNETQRVAPYLADQALELTLPIANVVALSPRRSFWEKATLIHSECHRPERTAGAGAERISRHWYDLAMLANHDIGQAAQQDVELLANAVKLKGIFYRSGFANYEACLNQGFRLVPTASLRAALAKDYDRMISEGMFFAAPPPFTEILDRLAALEESLNQQRLGVSTVDQR